MKVSIGKAAKKLGVRPETLRRWESDGKIDVERTPKGHRRYDLIKLNKMIHPLQTINRRTFCYARVSGQDQKQDLIRQIELLESFCASKGWTYEMIQDLGSGLNYKKKGLKIIIKMLMSGEMDRLVLTHKDRLLRFGSELIFFLCAHFGIDVVIINKKEETSFEDDLVQDVLEIITVFSARLYGSRSRKNKKLLEKLSKAMNEL